jgi:adenylate cyclase
MQRRRTPRITLDSAAVRVPTVGFPRAIERQIADIMAKSAPRRDGIASDRGIVSVLFVRIDGYVGLCETLPAPEIGSILALYLRTVNDSVGTYAGTVQGTLGDILVATWNAAYPQPDHALLAANAAIDMVERMDDLNRRLGPDLPEIRYAIGVNTGDALILRTGARRSDHEVVGDSINIAQLLCAQASDGCILIGEGTQISTDGDIITEDAGLIQLPGRKEPVHAYSIKGRSI